MKLGFYYHIVVFKDAEDRIFLPAYLGLFVDELAKNVEKLYYFAYTVKVHTTEQNYELKQKNIFLVDLSVKKSFPFTVLLGYCLLKRHREVARICDKILVRAPSPLAPWFYFTFRRHTKLHYLMVGDYMEGIKHQHFGFVKQSFINIFTTINEYLQNKAVKYSSCIVNSKVLYLKYENFAKKLFEVKTTTLSVDDFFERKDTCVNDEIKVIYTGGLYLSKGLVELIKAISFIESKNISLHFVGSEKDPNKSVQKSLIEVAKELKIKNRVFFHGYKKTGNELNEMYRMADIYAIPSYFEGFPRTIWEAMANSLPVIATKVGSIPYFLKNETDALLIESHNIEQLKNAIERIIQDGNLRRNMMKNGYSLAKDNTLENQTLKMIEIIKNN